MRSTLEAVLGDQLAGSPFWRRVGFQLDTFTHGTVRVRLPYHDDNTTAAQALHGGAIAATLEVAGCLAAWSAQPAEGVAGRTLSCDVSYIAGALGEDIFGEGEVLRRGKEIVYCAVRALNADGKLLATGNHIYHLAPATAVPPPPTSGVQPVTLGRTLAGLGGLPAADSATVERNIALLAKMDGRMPYMAQLGWTFTRGGFGYAQYELPCRGHALGEGGGLAGGVLLSAVDHAGSLAAWMTTELGNRALFGSTVNTKLQTFAPLIPRDCQVSARAAGGHGDLVNSEVSIVTRDGEPVASGSTVYRIVRRDRT